MNGIHSAIDSSDCSKNRTGAVILSLRICHSRVESRLVELNEARHQNIFVWDRRRMFALLFGVLIPIAVILLLFSKITLSPPVKIKDRISDFKVVSLDGDTVLVNSQCYDKLILVILSVECHSCIEELKCLGNAEAIVVSKGIKVLVVFEDDAEAAMPVIDQCPDYVQVGFADSRVIEGFGVILRPAMYFIKDNMILHDVKFGYQNEETISAIASTM